MRKYLLALFLLGVCFSTAKAADTRGVPVDQYGRGIHNVDYGGVNYSTSAFSALLSTVTFSTQTVQGEYTFFGVEFTSGTCGIDYVTVWDSSNAVTAHNQVDAQWRFYNVNGSTTVAEATGGTCKGYSGPRYPIRFNLGLLFQPSSAAYNRINVLYRKD